MEQSHVTPLRDTDRLRRGIAATLAVSLLLTLRLWLTERDYPLTPVAAHLPAIPFPLDYILLGLMWLALLGVIFLANPRIPLWIVCAITLLWVVFDQSRLQPYLFHPVVMLGSLLLVKWEQRDRHDESLHWSLAPARLLMVFTYIYSGLEKLNHEFADWLFLGTIEPLLGWFGISADAIAHPLVVVAAIAAAMLEAAGGILLIIPRTRRIAVYFLTAMHLFILLAVGPFGSDSNRAILAWNVGMIIALLFLFRNVEDGPTGAGFFTPAWWRQAFSPNGKRGPARVQTLTIAAVTLLFGLMPILGFPGVWDSYPSFALYSGNTLDALIWVDPRDHSRLPASAGKALREDGTIDLNRWSIEETGAMLYPERRIVLNIAQTIAKRWAGNDVLVWMAGDPDTFTGERRIRNWRCPAGGGEPVEVRKDLFRTDDP